MVQYALQLQLHCICYTGPGCYRVRSSRLATEELKSRRAQEPKSPRAQEPKSSHVLRVLDEEELEQIDAYLNDHDCGKTRYEEASNVQGG